MNKNVYDFSAVTIEGKVLNFSNLKGKTLLIVNTASKCGFTPQFRELEELYKKYRNENFEILGFPCNQFSDQDPGSDDEIKSFCEINYGVTFRIFSKIDVNGENSHPLYQFLKREKRGILSAEIKWNFTKFLVDGEGNVIRRYAPSKSPSKIEKDIKKLIDRK